MYIQIRAIQSQSSPQSHTDFGALTSFSLLVSNLALWHSKPCARKRLHLSCEANDGRRIPEYLAFSFPMREIETWRLGDMPGKSPMVASCPEWDGTTKSRVCVDGPQP